MAGATLISVEEYLGSSYDPDCDFLEGHLVERNVGELDHSDAQTAFAVYLRTKYKSYWCGVEARVQVTPTRFRVPDVTLVAGGPDADARLSLGDCDVTSVVISGGLPARAFLADGHRSTPDTPGGQPLCIQIEPVNRSYDNTRVDLSTIRMYLDAPDPTPYLAAIGDKTMVAGDRDRNGIQEITACFAPEQIRALLDGTQGRQTVSVTIVAEVLKSNRRFFIPKGMKTGKLRIASLSGNWECAAQYAFP